ncbi:MAG: phosphatidate cytidylyltransferase [Pseudomonadota bacterium]|nr:phosphatidate cytidylyltransferase [Pseudomonadota bacterium]
MSELLLRTLTGAGLIVLSLMAAVVGGYSFAILVAAVATGIYYEWSRMVRGWGVGWKILGFFYALLPALAMLWIRDQSTGGLALLMWVFITTWSVDIGGYVVGRSIGRRKLAPTISPGKTWEGFFGGVATAAVASAVWITYAELPRFLIPLAPIFAAAAQGGDLFESWMKRKAGVKDSGSWLPGHGGLLDRLDGLVPVAILTALLVLADLA